MESHDSPAVHGRIVCIVNNNTNNKLINYTLCARYFTFGILCYPDENRYHRQYHCAHFTDSKVKACQINVSSMFQKPVSGGGANTGDQSCKTLMCTLFSLLFCLAALG